MDCKRTLVQEQNRLRSKKRRLIRKKRRPNIHPNVDLSSSDESDPEIQVGSSHIPQEISQEADCCEGVSSGSSPVVSDDNLDHPIREDVVGDECRSASEIEDEHQNSSSNEPTEGDSSASESTSGLSDEDTDEDSDIDDHPEIKQLREWAIDCKILQIHLDKLLNILRSRLLPTLPKSSKTFLKTNDADYQIQRMEDSEGGMGSFVYLGLAKGLTDCVNHKLHRNGVIELQVHADAMPVTKSGTDSLWVLLGKVHFDPDIYQPFEIAIFQGQNKPNNLRDFLDPFVDEFNELHTDGIEISGRNFNIALKCIIADTPARAFLKNTLGHGGICACERCSIYGERVDSTTVYPSVNAEERTDESFRNFEQPEHHHGPSPFLRLRQMINLIAFFVLDFMHLCCQGVMKKLIEYWMSADLNFKLSARDKIELSNRLRRMRSQIPREFQRKTRAIKHYPKWKATEFRFFLLYSGPIVLKGLLKDQLYNHFLLFHVACRILCSKKVCLKYASSAKRYLISFFIAMKDFYGPKSQILNVHHLIHLADDVLFMKCSLSMITAFPFENLLGKIQKQLRTAYRPLAQLCRRLHEQSSLRKRKPHLPPLIEITKIRHEQVREIKYKQLAISTKSPNNVILLNDGIIMKVQKIFGNPEMLPEMLQVKGFVWDRDQSIYQYPCDSTKLEMWELKGKASNNVITRPVTSISNKLVQLSIVKEDRIKRCFAVGMLH